MRLATGSRKLSFMSFLPFTPMREWWTSVCFENIQTRHLNDDEDYPALLWHWLSSDEHVIILPAEVNRDISGSYNDAEQSGVEQRVDRAADSRDAPKNQER